MAEENESLRNIFSSFAVHKKERRDPFKSLLFGTVWLTFLCEDKEDHEKTGRTLRLSTETEMEREERQSQEESDRHRARNHPTWIRSSVFCSTKLRKMEEKEEGPAVDLREKYPSPTLEDCPKIATELLEIALENGLEKETCMDFKAWLGRFPILTFVTLRRVY